MYGFHEDLPLIVTKHIAVSLDLPDLFLGRFGERRVDYLHISRQQSFFGGGGTRCIILKMYEGYFALYVLHEDDISPVVRIEEADDGLWQFLQPLITQSPEV